MANESVTAESRVTKAIGFKEYAGKPLLQVCDGIELRYAQSEASCLEGAVRKLLDNAAADDGMCGDIAHLCEFAMATAEALRSASYGR